MLSFSLQGGEKHGHAQRLQDLRKKANMTAMICSLTALSGCVYANNKNWDDMTAEEKQEARQEFKEIREELEEESSGSEAADKFAQYILNQVEHGMELAD